MRKGCARIGGTRGGFTLLEVAVATLVLLVAVGGLSSAVVSARQLARANEETAIADAAARATAESLQDRLVDVAFRDIFASFNADPGDDPGGPGTAPGKDFAVRGLSVRPDDPDGFVGEIRFPAVDLGAGDLALREDFDDPSLGMPRDLNGDGDQDGADHSDDYVILPVTVRLEWKGVSGNRFLEVDLLLVE
jgi:type II secretory pathway pseudopilin PulG